MRRPPTLSTTAIRSRSSDPSTFCARTRSPSRTGSTQTRTFGTPSTSIRQFGQPPEQQRSPRARWYLKLREKMRRPETKSADPIVSPAKASTVSSPKEKASGRVRSMRSPGRGGSLMRAPSPNAQGRQRTRTHGRTQAAAPAKPARPSTASQAMPQPRVLRTASTSDASCDERPHDLVRTRVALGLEPRAAAEAVVPPLALDAGNVPAEVEVRGELAQRGFRPGPGRHLAGAGKLVHVAQPAVGAAEQERHLGCAPRRGRSTLAEQELQLREHPEERVSGRRLGGVAVAGAAGFEKRVGAAPQVRERGRV